MRLMAKVGNKLAIQSFSGTILKAGRKNKTGVFGRLTVAGPERR